MKYYNTEYPDIQIYNDNEYADIHMYNDIEYPDTHMLNDIEDQDIRIYSYKLRVDFVAISLILSLARHTTFTKPKGHLGVVRRKRLKKRKEKYVKKYNLHIHFFFEIIYNAELLIFRNRDLMLVTLSYGVSVGVPAAWMSVLNYSLKELGIHQVYHCLSSLGDFVVYFFK